MSKTKKEGASSSSQINDKDLNPDTDDMDAVRALVAELRGEGVADPAGLLRAGTVRWTRRVLAAYRADPAKGRRWLEAVLRDGASMLREPGPQLSELDRQRITSFDRLYRQSTGREWSTA